MRVVAAIIVLMLIFVTGLANARPTLAEPHGSKSASHV